MVDDWKFNILFHSPGNIEFSYLKGMWKRKKLAKKIDILNYAEKTRLRCGFFERKAELNLRRTSPTVRIWEKQLSGSEDFMDSFENLGRTYIACHVILVLSQGQVIFDCEATVKPASKCKIALFLAVASFVQYFCYVVVRYSAKDKLFRWRNLLCTSHATAPWMFTSFKWSRNGTWILAQNRRWLQIQLLKHLWDPQKLTISPTFRVVEQKTLISQVSIRSRRGGGSTKTLPKLRQKDQFFRNTVDLHVRRNFQSHLFWWRDFFDKKFTQTSANL